MKRSFTLLVSAGLLLCVAVDRGLAQVPGNSVTAPASSAGAAVLLDRTAHRAEAKEYYVDCSAFEKKGEGHAAETAWNGIAAINGHQFVPGDVIYLKRGTECHGLLWPKGSGTASGVIRLSAYGRGARPKVIAGPGDEEAFKLFNQEYWEVDSIDFAGGKIFGVFVSGDTGVLHHIHLRNLLVHDVHGGDVKHKESGLVVISPGKVPQHFEDVLVEGVTAYETEQWAGILVGGGNFGEVSEENWNSRVVVRNSVVHNVYGDGIILFRVKDGLIENSAAWYTGMQPTQSIGTPNAIWTWMCKDCVVRRCEAFLTDSPGVDGGAFDIDYGNTRNSVLDSYGHDTQGYCIAVFGAGYVTQASVVQGNLCINNGKSPRMAQHQGAIFLWTWNGGAIENLRVEKNSIYWRPVGDFPAVLNRAEIRGSERVFRDNQIYSSGRKMVESNKQISFENNQYITCGASGARWTFDGQTYPTLETYRAGTGQEEGSSWKSEKEPGSCLGDTRAQAAITPGWTISSEIPARIDADGLLDAASAGQLMVLKNVYRQFRASGLRMIVTLELEQSAAGESLQNVIHDFGMDDVRVSEKHASGELTQPKMRFIAPDGAVAKEWQGFMGPAEIGLEMRKTLGEPQYSQWESEDGSIEH
jgi:hypothetical protein